MKVEIISNKNPYILDYVKGTSNIVALTRKNVEFMKAIISLDSNYKDEENIYNENGSNFWFKCMMDHSKPYDDCLKEAIIRIDIANSTHLESTENGREKMFQIIKKYCPNVERLKEAIVVNPSTNNRDNLFFELCVTMTNRKNQKANNISFASKFIFYPRKYLNNDVTFSKYDKVVSESLSCYQKIYVDSSIKENRNKYLNNVDKRKNFDDKHKQIYTYNTYINYMNAINEILDCLKRDNEIIINQNEFDSVVWYAFK